ncbi:MAG: hypothetical protein WB507_01380 [Solirubrobacterales bacterium]
MRRLPTLHDESGTTLVELLVATTAGVVVMFAISAMVIVSLRETDRVNTHVDATQRGRIVLNRVIEELHSACIAPEIAPVRKLSNGNMLEFIHQTGSAVSLAPILTKVSLSSGIVSQSNYASTGGSAPNWTFSGTPSSTEQIMTNVSPTAPSTSIFHYYSYTNGVVTEIPVTTELGKENAERTVEVKMTLTAGPLNTPVEDSNAAANLTDAALLRFSPAPYNTTAANLPCQ